MREYELYFPLYHNDDTKVDPAILHRVEDQLREEFGGVTFFPQRSKGVMQKGKKVVRDDIVLFRVASEKTRSAEKFFKQLKKALERELEQQQILIVVRKIKVLA